VVSLAVLSVTSFQAISTLGASLDAAVNNTAAKLELVGATEDAFQKLKSDSVREQIAYAILELERRSATQHQARAGDGTSCASCHTPAAVDDSVRGLEAAGAVVQQRVEKLRGLVSDEAARKALDVFDKGASGWLASNKEYLGLAGSRRFEDAHTVLTDKMFPILEEVEKASQLLSGREREALALSNRQAQRNISASRWTAILLIGLNLLVAAAVLWVVRGIKSTLRRAVADMSDAAGQVAASVGQVTAASESLAQGASEQAASIEETSASGEEIGSMARKNSENARAAAELATQSQRRFAETNRSLDQMVLAMGEIDSQSGKIAKIIKTIFGIWRSILRRTIPFRIRARSIVWGLAYPNCKQASHHESQTGRLLYHSLRCVPPLQTVRKFSLQPSTCEASRTVSGWHQRSRPRR